MYYICFADGRWVCGTTKDIFHSLVFEQDKGMNDGTRYRITTLQRSSRVDDIKRKKRFNIHKYISALACIYIGMYTRIMYVCMLFFGLFIFLFLFFLFCLLALACLSILPTWPEGPQDKHDLWSGFLWACRVTRCRPQWAPI